MSLKLLSSLYLAFVSADHDLYAFLSYFIDKLNPQGSIHSKCVKEYPEINAQNLQLSWTPVWYVGGLEQPRGSPRQVLVISRQNHPNERLYYIISPSGNSKIQSLRLDSQYCITPVTTWTRSLEQYFTSEGNSTLHHCNESCKYSKKKHLWDHLSYCLREFLYFAGYCIVFCSFAYFLFADANTHSCPQVQYNADAIQKSRFTCKFRTVVEPFIITCS